MGEKGIMIYPKFISKNSTIGVSAPSDGVYLEDLPRLDSAIKNFHKLGYGVRETENVRTTNQGRSSSAISRARQLESLFTDSSVDMIICAAGGDFLFEMLSLFDFSKVVNHPKWIQGYSDPTSLLFVITTNYDIATIYGDNFKAFGMKPWHQSLKNNLEILQGNLICQNSFSKYEKERSLDTSFDRGYHLTEKVCWKNLNDEEKIEISGRMIGGCIDILNDLFGTRFDKIKEFIEKYKEDGIIWYFDNCELSNDQLIRTLWKFKDNGYFQYTRGILFGRSAVDSSSYDISFIDTIKTSLSSLNIPIILDSDIGHVSPRMTIINGAIAKVKCIDNKGSIEFELR